MANNSAQVLVAGDAKLWLAPYGSTVPAGTAAPGTAWSEAGYITEDGATFSLSRSTEDLNVWQDLDPVRVIVTGFRKAVSMTLRQWNPQNLKYALGGGSVALGGTATYGTYTYPASSENPSLAVILDTWDGAYLVRFIWPNMQVTGDLEVALGRTDSMNLPISLTSLSAADRPTIISTHPAFIS